MGDFKGGGVNQDGTPAGQKGEDVSVNRNYPKTVSHQNADRAKTDDSNQVAGDRHEDGTPKPGSEEERFAREASQTGPATDRDPAHLQQKQQESEARRKLSGEPNDQKA